MFHSVAAGAGYGDNQTYAFVKQVLPGQHDFFRQMTTNKDAVVRLYYDCFMEFLPRKGSVEHRLFGFSKLASEEDECELLGLYQGLIKILECPLKDFLYAFEAGKLPDLIETKFSEVEEDCRGEYYGWFKANRALLDGLVPASGKSL